MRITGGQARGIQLQLPRRGVLLDSRMRPATDALRAAVFSSLAQRIPGARVLDLFAGTGAYGLEALSRGAQHVTWVENHPAAAAAIRANLAAVAKSLAAPNPSTLGQVFPADVFSWSPPPDVKFDLVFADPPYALLPERGDALLARAVAWLGPDSRLVLAAPGAFSPTPPAGWTVQRRLGKGARQPGALIFAPITAPD
jgi:16S rRNA (guanine966-N2)-methyltransferase